MEVLLRPWLPAALFEPLLAQMPWNIVRAEREDKKREDDIEQGGYTEGGGGVLEVWEDGLFESLVSIL